MKIFKEGQTVRCVNTNRLSGNEEKPELRLNQQYVVKSIVLDSKGNQHLDVGLSSSLAYVRSYETKENLPDGDTIHWCHPSRFELAD